MNRQRRLWVLLAGVALTGAVATTASAADKPAKADSGQIVMYVAPQCGYCEKARQVLAQHKVKWQERDILASAAYKAEWEVRGGRGTPLIVIGERVIHGLDVARIESALAERAP